MLKTIENDIFSSDQQFTLSFKWIKIAEDSCCLNQKLIDMKFQQTDKVLDTIILFSESKVNRQLNNCGTGISQTKTKLKWTTEQKDQYIISCYNYMIKYQNANISWKTKRPRNFFNFISQSLVTRTRENIKSHDQNIKKKNQYAHFLAQKDFKHFIFHQFAKIETAKQLKYQKMVQTCDSQLTIGQKKQNHKENTEPIYLYNQQGNETNKN